MTYYRIFYQIALFVVGILLAVLGYSGTVNDIWATIGIALIVCSGLRIFRHIRMNKDPEYREKVMIAQKDERNIAISNKAASVAFRIILFSVCLVELLLFAFELIEIGTSVGLVACAMVLVYWLCYIVYSKKM